MTEAERERKAVRYWRTEYLRAQREVKEAQRQRDYWYFRAHGQNPQPQREGDYL